PSSSTPFTRQCLAKASTGNLTTRPLGVVSVWLVRSIFTMAPGPAANSSACTSGGTMMGSSEFFSELARLWPLDPHMIWSTDDFVRLVLCNEVCECTEKDKSVGVV